MPDPTPVTRPDELSPEIEFVDINVIRPRPAKAFRLNDRVIYIKSSRALTMAEYIEATQNEVADIRSAQTMTEDAAFTRRAERLIARLIVPEGTRPVTVDELRQLDHIQFFALISFADRETPLKADIEAALNQRDPRFDQPNEK